MQILAEHVSCIVSPNELQAAIDAKYGDIYIITPTGVFKRTSLSRGRHIQVKVPGVPGIKMDIQEEFNFLPAGKLPYKLFEEIVAFFRQVMTVKKAEQEAMAHVLWNETDGYHIGIPSQVVSKASVRHNFDDIKPRDIIVLDIHSHNTMGAFFSGTDNSDDRISIGFSGVVGKLNDNPPMTVWRFNINEVKKDCTIDSIFDMPEATAVVKQEWLDKITTVTQHPTTYRPGQYSGGGKPGKWGPPMEGGEVRLIKPNLGDGGRTNIVDLYRDAPSRHEPDVSAWDNWNAQLDLESGGVYGYNAEDLREIDRQSSLSPKEINAMGGLAGKKPFGDHEIGIADVDPDPEDIEARKFRQEFQAMVSGDRGLGTRGTPYSEEEKSYYISEHGKNAADAIDQISIWLPDLESNDELLLEVISTAYQLLSSQGQERLQTNGL